jgi:hypothetical protein
MGIIRESRQRDGDFGALRWLSIGADRGGIALPSNNRLHPRHQGRSGQTTGRRLDAVHEDILHAGSGPLIAEHPLHQREGELI